MTRVPHSSPQTLRVFAALLADVEAWRYGYDLSRETGLRAGTLYPILVRLADQGHLETSWEPSASAGRPPRHMYRLTADGLALASERVAESSRRMAEAKRTATGPAGRAGARRGGAAPAGGGAAVTLLGGAS